MDGDKEIKSVASALGSFEADCRVSSSLIAERYPKCYEYSEKVVYNGRKYVLSVLAGSNQHGKRIIIGGMQ